MVVELFAPVLFSNRGIENAAFCVFFELGRDAFCFKERVE